MTTCFEGMRVFLVAFKKRPVMVTDNMCRVSTVYNPVSIVSIRVSNLTESYESDVWRGIFAFPLNCNVSSLIEVASVKTRATCPLSNVDSTSGPVPLRIK